LHRFDGAQVCVIDTRADRRTDAQAMAKTREAFCYRAQLLRAEAFFSRAV